MARALEMANPQYQELQTINRNMQDVISAINFTNEFAEEHLGVSKQRLDASQVPEPADISFLTTDKVISVP